MNQCYPCGFQKRRFKLQEFKSYALTKEHSACNGNSQLQGRFSNAGCSRHNVRKKNYFICLQPRLNPPSLYKKFVAQPANLRNLMLIGYITHFYFKYTVIWLFLFFIVIDAQSNCLASLAFKQLCIQINIHTRIQYMQWENTNQCTYQWCIMERYIARYFFIMTRTRWGINTNIFCIVEIRKFGNLASARRLKLSAWGVEGAVSDLVALDLSQSEVVNDVMLPSRFWRKRISLHCLKVDLMELLSHIASYII